MADVWNGLVGDPQWQNARGAAELVYRLLSDEYLRGEWEVDEEDTAERVLSELGVPKGVVKAIAHEQHEDTKAKAELIEAFECPPGLVMEWADNAEELRFNGFVGWAGENEDELIEAAKFAYYEGDTKTPTVEAYYRSERGYAQVVIQFGYEGMSPDDLEAVLEAIGGYRKEGMGSVLYEDAVTVEEE